MQTCGTALATLGHGLPAAPWAATWSCDGGTAFVYFDRQDRVERIEFLPSEDDGSRPFLARLRALLGW